MTDLTPDELVLWDAFPEARSVELPGASIRAEVIAQLLLGAREPAPGRVPTVHLTGARITGFLDLSHAETSYALVLNGCEFEQVPRLAGARTAAIALTGSRLPGLDAWNAQIEGLLRLTRCRFDGPVRMAGATVSGSVALDGAVLRGDVALHADSLQVGRDFLLRDAELHGEALMWSAKIGGTLVLEGARVIRPGGASLNGDGLVVEGGLFGGNGFVSEGEMRLQDARIGRRCTLSGARLTNPGGVALNAERLTVEGTLALDEAFTAEGEVTMRSALIQGPFLLDGAVLGNAGGTAFDAELVTIDGGLQATDGFAATGGVSLVAAQIRGSLNFDGARLANQGRTVLDASRLEVSGSLFCRAGFQGEGEIILNDAKVGVGVEFKGARLANPGGRALTAWGLTAAGVMDCCDGFTAVGRVSLSSAQIGSALCFDGASIDGDLSLSKVRAASLKTGPDTVFHGAVILNHTVIGVLDDVPARWPAGLRLDGFSYDSLRTPLPVKARLDWLAKEADGYLPQPYEQLASVYRRHGRDDAAREVLLAGQRRRRASQRIPLRIWGHIQDWTVGYGYRPFRAAGWLAALLVVATIVFVVQHPPPAKPAEAPPFNPFLYSLDLLLPVIGFGQEGAFNPRGGQQWFAAAMIASGWILATTIVTGISRNLARQ